MNTESIAEFRSLLRELDILSDKMQSHPRAGDLCLIIDRLQQWGCSVSDHDWQNDQCGYWQHQYCIECGVAKYPSMSKQDCDELVAKMGKMTEAEFLSATKPEAKPDCPPASCWANNLEDAMESLRKCRRHITDEEGKQLLYHCGMTIRTLQQRYDLSERNLG
jgi:hypothetical protein